MSYIIRTPHGPICSVCQSLLGIEEDDWDECDTCGGTGIWCEGYEQYPEDDDLDDELALGSAGGRSGDRP